MCTFVLDTIVKKEVVCSHHAGDELVDLLLTVTPDTTTGVRVTLLLEASNRGGELERPEEVVGLLEVAADGPDLVDKVLNAGNTLLAESSLNNGVVIDSGTGPVDLTVATLVDKLADGVTSGVAVSHVRLDHADHVDGSTVELHEDAVMELTKTKELHNLLLLGWQLVDTSGTDNERNLGLGLDVEVAGLLGSALSIDKVLVILSVLSGVLDSVGSSGFAAGSTSVLDGGAGLSELLEELGVSLLLFDDVLGDGLCHFIDSIEI